MSNPLNLKDNSPLKYSSQAAGLFCTVPGHDCPPTRPHASPSTLLLSFYITVMESTEVLRLIENAVLVEVGKMDE